MDVEQGLQRLLLSPTATTDEMIEQSSRFSSLAAVGGPAGRPKAGKGSRGPRPRLFKKGECQADGCSADLTGLPRYHQRNHICVPHKTADSFIKQGAEVRFCQRCGVSHPLPDFDGLKKSCRKQLAVHNNRRRKLAAGQAAQAAAPAAAAAAAAAAQSHIQSQGSAPVTAAASEAAAAAAAAASSPAAVSAAAVPVLPALAPALEVTLPQAQLEAEAEAGSWLFSSEQTAVAAAMGLDVAGLPASPSVSVGSVGLSGDPGSWLLEDSGSDGGGSGSSSMIEPGLADPAGLQWEVDQPLGQAAGASTGTGVRLQAAAACAAAAHERVCCDGACGACGACHMAAGPAAACGRQRPADACAVPCAAACQLGSAAPSPADGPSGSSAVAAPQPAAHDPSVSSAQHVSLLGGISSSTAAATAALEGLRQQNAAVYQMLVQQQLLAAHTLLAAAGVVLSSRLQPASISAH